MDSVRRKRPYAVVRAEGVVLQWFRWLSPVEVVKLVSFFVGIASRCCIGLVSCQWLYPRFVFVRPALLKIKVSTTKLRVLQVISIRSSLVVIIGMSVFCQARSACSVPPGEAWEWLFRRPRMRKWSEFLRVMVYSWKPREHRRRLICQRV